MGVGGWGNHQKDGRGGGGVQTEGGGGGAIYGWQPQNLDLSLMWSRGGRLLWSQLWWY